MKSMTELNQCQRPKTQAQRPKGLRPQDLRPQINSAIGNQKSALTYLFPCAIFTASGSCLRRNIESTPRNGPGARSMNAYRHETRLTALGISSIEIVVRRNPKHICRVKAVPMYCGSPSSVMHEEN